MSVAGKLQLYSLAVPTEKEGLTTTTIVLTVPAGFGIDSFVAPAAGWHMKLQQTGSGDSAVVTKVTWTGGSTPSGQDSLFQFLAQPASAKTYTFQVEQTYSDGSIVNWSGSESSEDPAPTIEAANSLGGWLQRVGVDDHRAGGRRARAARRCVRAARRVEGAQPGMSRARRSGLVLVVVAAALVAAAVAPSARADGDPGSDVLVYQDLFAGSDAGLSVQQQLELSGLLKATARAGAPVRVAVIASRLDLGAVTGLWRNPRAYARFLGIELSLVYKQRLLVVMPNGFGFNWPGHSPAAAYRALGSIPIRPGGDGVFNATEAAVRKLMLASGVKLPAEPASAARNGAGQGAGRPSGNGTDNTVGIVALSLVALVGIVLAVYRTVGRHRWLRLRVPRRLRARLRLRGRLLALPGAALLLVALAAVAVIVVRSSGPAESQADALAKNPYLDPGTPVSGAAPDFTLSDQFGQPASLHSFRGKVVILAFNDSECTTVCPLTTTAMLDAKAMLGKAGSDVQLLGVDANPAATSLEDVWSYSELHGMLHAWRFLTGSLSQLKQVWKRYGIEAAIERGEITHTPALFVIDRQGRLSRLYMTQMSYTAVPQLGQLLAQSASALLPGRPAVHANISYSRVEPITPADPATLPRAGGEPSSSARRPRPGCSCSSRPGIRRPARSPANSTRSTATRRSPLVPACRH